MLQFKEGRSAMEAFTKKEFNFENLQCYSFLPFLNPPIIIIDFLLIDICFSSFYMEVTKFRDKFNSLKEIHHPELLEDATKIFNHFVKEHAPEQINLTSSIVKLIQQRFTVRRSS